jgi:hypothetical protein
MRSLDGRIMFRDLKEPHPDFARWRSRQVTQKFYQQPGLDQEIPADRLARYDLARLLPSSIRLAIVPRVLHSADGSIVSMDVMLPKGWEDAQKELKEYWRVHFVLGGVEQWSEEEQLALGVVPADDLDETIRPLEEEERSTLDFYGTTEIQDLDGTILSNDPPIERQDPGDGAMPGA